MPYQFKGQQGISSGDMRPPAPSGSGGPAKGLGRLSPRQRAWYGRLLSGALFLALALGLSGHTGEAAPAPQPQGYAEVARNEDLILSAAAVRGVPAISVAAGIMNQGNALTRPFGTDLFERAQLAAPFQSSVTGMESSVGIAQLMPNELSAYVLGCRDECLFEPEVAVLGMAAKLGAADELLPADINPTDRLMVLALAQNSGPGAARAFLERDGHWSLIYQDQLTGHTGGLGDNDQLRKILVNLRFLRANGFQLPKGVDLNRWQQIVDTHGGLERFEFALRAAPLPTWADPQPRPVRREEAGAS